MTWDIDGQPIPDPAPSASVTTAKPKCRRHDWATEWEYEGGTPMSVAVRCVRCRKVRDDAAATRGKRNRSRGNSIEREVGKKLGLRRVGQYGGPDDLTNDLFAAQVKSGGAFSERYWSWLQAVPVNAGQTALLVVTDAPGPGHRRRGIVVLDLDAWRTLHGDDAA